MATTTPDDLRTPDLSDPYNLVPDLQTLANDVQDALISRANSYRGSANQRTSFTTAPDGVLWQDTDGIRMLWYRVAGSWDPVLRQASGSTSQMNNFLSLAPDGFKWFNTSDRGEYVALGGTWYPMMDSGRVLIPISSANTPTDVRVDFPRGPFPGVPAFSLTLDSAVAGSTVAGSGVTSLDASGFNAVITRSNTTSTYVQWVAHLK